MSSDTIDDLHSAEDTIGTLHTAVQLLNEYGYAKFGADWSPTDTAVLGEEKATLLATCLATAVWDYCRPSCEWDDEAYMCDEDCGCPCGHPLDPERDNG